MNRTKYFSLGIALFVVAAGGYFMRGEIRDRIDAMQRPPLPPASAYRPSSASGARAGTGDATTPFEPGYSSSQHYVVETAPAPKPVVKDPLAFTGTLPKEVNLDVPFTTQAPKGDWGMPYQEACEESSVIMVNAFYQGKTGVLSVNEADALIKRVVDYEKSTLGFYEDTNAEEAATFIRGYFGYHQVLIKSLTHPEDLKRVLALGYPVIVPAAGKELKNPNFRNGGPPFHMVVVRGYTPTMFITNDPGTRKGQGYTYSYDTLLNAAHDWTGDPATVSKGPSVMIIVLPNESL